MDIKNYLIQNAEREKNNCISLLQTNLSEEDRKAVSEKLNSINAQIEDYKTLEDGENAKFDKALQEMNNKFAAISEKLSENNIKVKGVNVDFLDSDKAMKLYANSVRGCISKKGTFEGLWGESLKQNGITVSDATPAGAYTPTPVKSMIDSKFKEYGYVLDFLNVTGAKSYYARFTSADPDNVNARAKGFNSGTNKQLSGANKTKGQQTLELAGHLINSEALYKLVEISNRTIWEDDYKMLEFIVSELSKQVFYEIVRCITIGDGRAANSDDKVTSIVPVGRTTTDSFVTVYNSAQSTESALVYFMDHIVLPLYDGSDDLILFVGKNDANNLRKRLNPTGADPVYLPLDEVAKQMGLRAIITVPYLDATTAGGYRAVCLHGNKYSIVGDITPTLASFENFLQNSTYMRMELFIGGNVSGLDAAICAVNPS